MLDLVLHDAQIIDGTGGARRRGDVGVRDGHIVALGDVDESAARAIDVGGAVVAPGFVDVHTHYDAQVFWDPALTPSSVHGVTTVVAGNCGFSVAPLNASAAEYLMTMLARVEGMPLSSLQSGVPWDWTTTAEYFDRLDPHVALNIGFMVGHSAIRRVVMGEAAKERAATADEVEAMKAMLRDGLAAGGLGFSTSIAQSHNDASGDPVPSRCASYDEISELAAVCGEFDGTSLELVPSGAPGGFPEDKRALMVEMSARARRTVNWNVVTLGAANVEQERARLAIADEARAAGGDILGLLMPMPISVRLNFASGFVLDMLPGWDKLMALPVSEKLAMLGSAQGRARMLAAAAQTDTPLHFGRWHAYMIHECYTAETKRYEGRIVGDIAQEEGKEPFDALADIAVADGLRTTFGSPPRVESRADWEARIQVLDEGRVLIGASDAGAHLDMLDTFRYATHLLQYGVREHGVLGTEEAVHQITQVPAELYGLRDRGVLREGAFADIVVFDEDTVGGGPVYTRHDLPGGAARLFADSTGIDYVIVNGEPVVDRGEVTDLRPGGVLRSGRDTTGTALR